MISHESSKLKELSRYSTSSLNFKKNKINSNRHYRSILKTTKTNRSNQRKKEPIKLNKIFEEEKGENMKNIFDDVIIQKPKLSFKEILSTISKKFHNRYNKYYTETKNITGVWGKIRPNLYGLYQINYLLINKKCKIKVHYDEFHLYYNDKENLIEFSNRRQNMILLKFIVTFLQGNNKYNSDIIIKDKYKYKAIYFRHFIKLIISKLNEKEIFKNSILSEIIDKIEQMNSEPVNNEIDIINSESFYKAYDYIKKNNIFEFNDINDLSDKLEEFLKFLPILINIPLIYYKSFLPNYFLFEFKIKNIIKHFVIKILKAIKKEKMNFVEKLEDKNKKGNSKTNSTNTEMNTYSRFINGSTFKSKGISFKTKDNKEEILDNEPIWSYFKNKKILENKRQLYDNEVIDIQNYVVNMKLSMNKTASFLIRKRRVDKNKNAFINKIMVINNRNKNNTNKIKESNSLKSNIIKNENKINKILNQKSTQNENKTRNKYKLLLSYNYKKNKKEEQKESKNSIRNFKNVYNSAKKSKMITQYNTKSHSNSQKNILNSMGNTKNSSSVLYNNDIYNLKQINNMNKISNIFYTSTVLLTGDSKRNKKNNFSQNNRSARNINVKNNFFKDSKEFLLQSLRNSQKMKFNRIELKKVQSFYLNQNIKNFFDSIQNYINYPKIKIENNEENVWEKGIYKEQHIKLDYNYNKLMQKIQKKISHVRKRSIYRNILDKRFSVTQISKMDDIYD